MRRFQRASIGIAVAALLGLPACNAAPPVAAKTPSTAAPIAPGKRIPLTIRTGKGEHKFRVEVARTEAEQARGLMFRTELASDAGMIFPFVPPRPASFWMRNTVISLDLIFIRANGTIARIAANAVPYSLDPIESGEPVVAVLEIAGGHAAALGLAPGDRVHWAG